MTIDTNKILQWIKTNKVFLAIIGVLVALLLTLGYSMRGMKNDNKILDRNYHAALEQVDTLRLKNGNLLAERNSFVASISDLEELLNISKKETKELQRKLDGKLLYISKLESEIEFRDEHPSIDTLTVYKDSSFIYKFNFSNDWYSVAGTSSINNFLATTTLDKVKMSVPLTVGLTEDWKIFVETPNPYVSFDSISGAVLDRDTYLKQKKVQRWGLSISLGFYGGYNLVGTKGFYLGPGGSIGVSYKFL